VHRVVPPDQLLDEAVRAARVIPRDSMTAYAASKKVLLAPTMRSMNDALDRLALEVVMAPDSVRSQEAAMARLKSKR
jgi:enoyl-CoA hydratase/carnithine racemase